MNQYYIFEIKRLPSGEFEHTVHWAYDTDATQARLNAESKFYQLLSVAAISQYSSHSLTLLTSDGRSVMQKSYTHATVDPEPDTPVEEE